VNPTPLAKPSPACSDPPAPHQASSSSCACSLPATSRRGPTDRPGWRPGPTRMGGSDAGAVTAGHGGADTPRRDPHRRARPAGSRAGPFAPGLGRGRPPRGAVCLRGTLRFRSGTRRAARPGPPGRDSGCTGRPCRPRPPRPAGEGGAPRRRPRQRRAARIRPWAASCAILLGR
jgi:hypothetical protein